MSINKKVPLIILSLVLISLIFTSTFMYLSSSKIVLSKGEQELHTYTKEVGKFVSQSIEENLLKVELISKHNEFRKLLEHRQSFSNDLFSTDFYNLAENDLLRESNKLLLQSKETMDDVNNIYVLDMSGTVVAHNDQAFLGKNFSHEEYFKKAIKGETTVGSMIISKLDGSKILVFATPIRNSREQILGIVGQVVSVNALNDMLINTKIGDKGYCYVVDSSGTILIHPQERKVGTLNDIEVLNTAINKEVAPENERDMETNFTEFEYNDKNMLMTYTIIPKTNWALAITNEVSDFRKPADDMFNKIIKFLIVIVIISAVLSVYISKKITAPINKLNLFIENMSTGDLSKTLTSSTGDEFDILANNINQMGKNFKKLINQIDLGAQELNSASDILKTSIKETSSSLDRTTGSIYNISSSIESQAKNTESLVSMTNSLEGNINFIKNENLLVKSIYNDFKKLSKENTNLTDGKMQQYLETMVTKINDIYYKTSEMMENLGVMNSMKNNTPQAIKKMSSSQEEIVASITEISNAIELQSEIMRDLLEISEFTSNLSVKLTNEISAFKM